MMKARFHKGLLVSCWIGWFAIFVLSFFRSQPTDADRSTRSLLLKSKDARPTAAPPGEPARPTVAEAGLRTVRTPTRRIAWPLVLQEIPALTPAQEAAKNRVVEDFIEKVGGEDQAGNDPAYRERWLALQPLADQQFRVLIGQEAFAACEMRIAQAAYAVSSETNVSNGANEK